MFSSSSVSVLLTLSLTRLLSPSSAVGKMGLKGVPGLNIVRELPGREGGNSNGRGGDVEEVAILEVAILEEGVEEAKVQEVLLIKLSFNHRFQSS